MIAFPNLAAYERYKARVTADPEGHDNFATAQAKQRFILREERNFVQVVDGTFEQPATFTDPER